jgi:hypothetical protein
MTSISTAFPAGNAMAGNHAQGIYCRNAVAIWPQVAGSSKALTVRSPDGSSRVVAPYSETKDDEHVELYVSGKIGSLKLSIGPGVSSEIAWQPDSNAFFVTTSDQGANGCVESRIWSLSRTLTTWQSSHGYQSDNLIAFFADHTTIPGLRRASTDGY